MATFISLVSFTDQGIRSAKDSPGRYEAFKAMAAEMGVTVKGLYYTFGRFDAVFVLEASDEAVATALMKVGSFGNVRTETMRGFSSEEMQAVVEKLP